jgi:hypothetical protein
MYPAFYMSVELHTAFFCNVDEKMVVVSEVLGLIVPELAVVGQNM